MIFLGQTSLLCKQTLKQLMMTVLKSVLPPLIQFALSGRSIKKWIWTVHDDLPRSKYWGQTPLWGSAEDVGTQKLTIYLFSFTKTTLFCATSQIIERHTKISVLETHLEAQTDWVPKTDWLLFAAVASSVTAATPPSRPTALQTFPPAVRLSDFRFMFFSECKIQIQIQGCSQNQS